MRLLKFGAGMALCLIAALSFAGPVNINTADAETISAELKGVGLAKARAIVEYRDKHGPFQSIEDLTLVSGIGERTLEQNRADIRLTAPPGN